MIGEKPRVYIMGPMSGLPDYNRDAFYDKADELRKAGCWPIHCADMPSGLSDDQYEKENNKRISTCRYFVLLDGWEKSEGVKRELDFAEKIGLMRIRLWRIEK